MNNEALHEQHQAYLAARARMGALTPRNIVRLAAVSPPPAPEPELVQPPEPPKDALSELIEQYRTVVDHDFSPQASQAKAKTILIEVSREHGIAIADIKGESRAAAIARARQIAMWRIAKETDWSLLHIGRLFNRDHTTVLHNIRRVNAITGENVKTAGVYRTKAAAP